MPRKLPNRNVTPLLDAFRTILRGKPLQHNALRFADKLAARTQPPPNLPPGPYARTTQMYYYPRDGRREVKPPTVVYAAGQIEAGKEAAPLKNLTPGKLYCPE